MMQITTDALIFGMAYLNGPKATLSFGGDGAKMKITKRAHDALDCLIINGFAVEAEPLDQIPNRKHYRGVGNIGLIAKEMGFNPFDPENAWVTFEKVGA